jgi:hypothetical protein
MKLSKTVLLEIVEIIREGLAEGKDISDGLRQLDLYVTHATNDAVELELTEEYLKTHPRAGDWERV